MKKCFKVFLLFFWSCLIFYFSSKNGQTSTSQSDFFVLPFMRFLNLKDYFLIVFLFRKFAHIFIYLVLSILFYWNVIDFKDFKRSFVYTLLFCFLFALSDEFHQVFINQRSGQLLDVLIDAIGFFSGSLFCYFLNKKN